MQVRRHLRACLRSDAAVALVHELIGQPPDPRAGEEREAPDRDKDGKRYVGSGRQRCGRREKHGHAPENQGAAKEDARERRSSAHDGFKRAPEAGWIPATPAVLSAPGPQDCETDRRQRCRPPELPSEPQPRDHQQDRQANEDEADTEELASCRPRNGPTGYAGQIRRCIDCLKWSQKPEKEVDDDAEPGRETEGNERDPNDQRIDAEVPAYARSNAGDHPIRSRSLQIRSTHNGRARDRSAGCDVCHGRRWSHTKRGKAMGEDPCLCASR